MKDEHVRVSESSSCVRGAAIPDMAVTVRSNGYFSFLSCFLTSGVNACDAHQIRISNSNIGTCVKRL